MLRGRTGKHMVRITMRTKWLMGLIATRSNDGCEMTTNSGPLGVAQPPSQPPDEPSCARGFKP